MNSTSPVFRDKADAQRINRDDAITLIGDLQSARDQRPARVEAPRAHRSSTPPRD
jgi:hypothetical protein